jgi:ABC-type amino acid transport substrate-binding protein
MTIKLKKIAPLAILFQLLSLFLFSQVAQASDTTFDRIQKEGVLIVGMSGEQPPFNFVSRLDKVIGYDMDLAATIGKSMGVKVRIELMPFSTLMKALQKREIDVIISGFASTEARSKELTFVGPYALSGKSLVVTKERLKEITAATGFNDKSVHLMALEHSTSKSLAEERLSKAKLTTIKHYEDAILALRAGEADALVADLAICELAVIRDSTKRLTTLQKPLAVEEISIAINKDEPLLEARLTEELRALTQSGEINDIRDKWFNSPGWLELLP